MVGRSSRLREHFLSATPVLVVGLTVFVIAFHMRHYSTACDYQSTRAGALNRAAMERRIRALEDEVIQNSLYLEKVLQGLDAVFQASAVLSVKELRLLAQAQASDLGERRVRKPAPPMSKFARSRISEIIDGGTLQDLVEAAVGLSSSSGGYNAAVGQGNGEWDWGETQSSAADDFLNAKEVEIDEPIVIGVSEEERGKSCGKWLREHDVTPGVDWGTLPADLQTLWKQYRCDEAALDSPAPGPKPPPPPMPPGEVTISAVAAGSQQRDSGAGKAAAAGGRR